MTLIAGVVHFSSSDTFMEDSGEPHACGQADVPIVDYLEATYDNLRSGPHGETIAYFSGGAWELSDGRRFSDWAVHLT